jgi:hypothetical protein
VLDPVRQIEGFVHACLIDATSGMILSSLGNQDEMRLPVAAAGATDIVNVLTMMTGELASRCRGRHHLHTPGEHRNAVRPGAGGHAGLRRGPLNARPPLAGVWSAHRRAGPRQPDGPAWHTRTVAESLLDVS